MSINHFSSDLPEAHWWSHYLMLSSSSSSPPPPPPPHNPPITSSSLSPHTFWLSPAAAPPMFNSAVPFDLNNDDDDDQFLDEQLPADNLHHDLQIPKERLFEKPLTPSDVGKLNRLVIPKQHAEKHFPLNAAADSGENGLLLGFEDELGKSWRFRYSYWNSSQSYVLTKGWSRFVKEKRLDAGDVVVFARHRADAGRLFIGWRRRNSLDGGGTQAAANGGGWSRVVYSGHPNYQIQQQGQGAVSTSLSYQPENVHAGVQNQTTTSVNGNSKRLRLFGVNMECQTADDSEPSTPVGSPMSSQQHQHQHHPYYQQQYYTSNHHMDISFSGAAADVYRQG